MSDWQDAPNRRFAVVRRETRPVRLELHPVLAGFLGVLLLALLGWAGAVTSYALFRDEFLTQLLSRHYAVERTANAEIARLKTELTQASTRLLVEREGFVEKLDVLTRRQGDLERRHEALSGIPLRAESAPDPALGGDLRLGNGALRESRTPYTAPATISALNTRLSALEEHQKGMISALETRLDAERGKYAAAYAALGLAAPSPPVKAGIGGLYLPLGFTGKPADQELSALEDRAREMERLKRGLEALPVRNPAPGASFTSGYGMRVDPFLGKPAFHNGVDFDSPPGSPALAAGSGTVVHAGWNGGYGLSVDVRHPSGHLTRYAHLSALTVTEGEDVMSGQILGRTGNTGRSTGPHLHFEVHQGERSVDPRRFLSAGKGLFD